MTELKPLKFLIADDHEVVRQGLKQLVTDAFGKVIFGEAANAAEACARVWKERWDLVILDINMPGRNGLDVLGDLKKEKPKLPVLVLSMFSEAEYALRALKAGAAGYVSKQSVSRELIDASKKALAGGRYVTPALAEKLAASLGREDVAWPHEALSDREFEVMKLIATGRAVKEIAAVLSLGEKTIFTYRTRLLEKLGVKGDVEVARYAIRHNLVE